MKIDTMRGFVGGLIVMGLSSPWIANALSQEGMKMTEEQMQAWKRFEECCTPGEFHLKLSPLLGKYDVAISLIMGQDAAVMKSTGTAEFRWLLEGRWLQGEIKGEMMGRPLHGFGTMGYDNFKHKYVTAFVDSLTTTLLTSEGNFDQHGNLITFGLIDEPLDWEHDKQVRYIWRFPSKDQIIYEVHDMAIGEANTKVIEMVYTRKSG